MADTNYADILSSLIGGYGTLSSAAKVNSLSNLLQKSYTNPSSAYSQYASTDSAFYNQLQRQNAADGRTTDAYKTGVAREAAYNNWLNSYRSGLASQLGAYSKIASQYNSLNPLMTLLGKSMGNVKDKEGNVVQNPVAKMVNSGLNSAANWVGKETGWWGNNDTSSDPTTSNWQSYSNPVSDVMSSTIENGWDKDKNNSNQDDYVTDYNTGSSNSSSSSSSSDSSSSTLSNLYNYGTSLLSNLFGS